MRPSAMNHTQQPAIASDCSVAYRARLLELNGLLFNAYLPNVSCKRFSTSPEGVSARTVRGMFNCRPWLLYRLNGVLGSLVIRGTSGFAVRKPTFSACCCTGGLERYFS